MPNLLTGEMCASRKIQVIDILTKIDKQVLVFACRLILLTWSANWVYPKQICFKWKKKKKGVKFVWNTKTNTEQCKAQNMHRDWVCPEQVHYSCMICCCLLFQSPFKQPPPFLHICLPLCFFFVSFWHGVDKIWISNNLFSFWKKRQASILYCRFKNQISIKF